LASGGILTAPPEGNDVETRFLGNREQILSFIIDECDPREIGNALLFCELLEDVTFSLPAPRVYVTAVESRYA
jgi:hypothetical protein